MQDTSTLQLNALRNLFVNNGRKINLSENQFLYQHRDLRNNIFFLDYGKIKAYYINEDGEEKIMGIYRSPILIGEDVFLKTDGNRWLNVAALCDCIIYSISAEFFTASCMNSRELFDDVMLNYLKKMKILGNYVYISKCTKAESKVAFFIYENYKNDTLSLSQTYISECTGMTRVTVSRILNSFKKQGIIDIHYKKITIKDPDRLKEILSDDTIVDERIDLNY